LDGAFADQSREAILAECGRRRERLDPRNRRGALDDLDRLSAFHQAQILAEAVLPVGDGDALHDEARPA